MLLAPPHKPHKSRQPDLNFADTQTLPTINTSDSKAHHYRHILLFNRNAALGNTETCSHLLKKICKHDESFSTATMLNHLLTTNQFEETAKAAEHYRAKYGKDDWEVNLCAARALSALKETDRAQEMFIEASRSAKKTWDKEQTTYAQAVFYIQNQKLAEALQKIDSFLAETTPRGKHALFYFLKATIHLNGQHPQFETALTQLNKSLELNPHFERSLKLKALVLEQQDKKSELIPVLRQIIAIEPQAALSKRLVSLLFELGRLNEAYEALADLHDKTADHFYDLALISWKLKNHTQALGHVNKAIEINKEFARARLLKLEILLTSDRKLEALSHLKNWIVVEKDTKAFSILSMLTGSQTITPRDSIGLLESIAATSSASQKEVHSFLGDLHAMTGNFKAAEMSYRKFLRALSKDDKAMGLKAMYNLGFVQWKQHNLKAALAEVSRAHSIDPKNALITNFLAFLYIQQGDKLKVKKARELLETAQHMEAGEEPIPQLSSLLAAQESAYKLSPFWSNLDAAKITIEQPPLDSKTTLTAHTPEFSI